MSPTFTTISVKELVDDEDVDYSHTLFSLYPVPWRLLSAYFAECLYKLYW